MSTEEAQDIEEYVSVIIDIATSSRAQKLYEEGIKKGGQET